MVLDHTWMPYYTVHAHVVWHILRGTTTMPWRQSIPYMIQCMHTVVWHILHGTTSMPRRQKNMASDKWNPSDPSNTERRRTSCGPQRDIAAQQTAQFSATYLSSCTLSLLLWALFTYTFNIKFITAHLLLIFICQSPMPHLPLSNAMFNLVSNGNVLYSSPKSSRSNGPDQQTDSCMSQDA